MKEELYDLLKAAIEELKEEGLNPDIILAGPEFLKYAADILQNCGLAVYEIKELNSDAVIADSQYLGQLKRASRRISIELLFKEKEVWEEIQRV
ncbi:DUF1884 domain-containing protein [Thermococcus sp. M39]|uniref:family 4B encapsulin nanocompartment shell protein n=1 Tax=unclassified Thermococcus TaxID=2627626 RepID=UPI00143A66D2|nr:DUF1884 domain-containing protein [Thermococcus sp. M39]NJE11573.1 DUF1884 domain-containing protein [Thermococcus sp. LS2]